MNPLLRQFKTVGQKSMRRGYKTVSKNFVREYRLTDPTAVIVDVREPSETADGVILNASLVPLGHILTPGFVFPSEMKIFKDDAVLVYCRSGKRSVTAAVALEKLGYTNILNYGGGWLDWSSDSK